MENSNTLYSFHSSHPTSLAAILKSIWLNRLLIKQMSWRQITGRYKGSLFGLVWSLLTPLCLLAMYTFVFSEIFNVRWDTEQENTIQFSLILFTGMITLTTLTEVVSQAPSLIIGHANYVKKVIFPLEILPVISMVTSLFNSLVSLSALLIVFFLLNGYIHWTILFVPAILLPLIILTLGMAWFFSSLGVFIRDLSHTTNLLVTLLMFLSPVLYPISAVPEKLAPILMLNPLTFIITQMREVIIWGHIPDWRGLLIYSVTATCVTWLGFVWFQKTRKGFADVL